MIGTSVDRYKILEELGHGGMSVVYRSIDTSLEREVAVKLLHNHLAKKIENRRRFHREAKAIARLRHPNILEVYDFSAEDADRSYIVMEYVAGRNLRQFIAEHGHPPPEIAALIGIEICNALAHAHDHGVIHRDLKPENVMVSRAGEVKLMDFGIAHVIDAETMTQTGSLMGSPAHMAPELIEGEKVDVRVDVFALGTVLYWLSTGKLPFEGQNAPQVLKKVLEGNFPDPEIAEPRTGREFARIICQCLAHDPADRYATVREARAVLEEFAARIGLEEPSTELKRYFNDPARYGETFEEEIVDRLIPVARRAQAEKDTPCAVGIYNRILAYDPENEEVQSYLESLCRRKQTGRYALVAAAVLLVSGGLSWWLVSPNTNEPSPDANETRPSVDLTAVTPSVHDSVERARLASEAERAGEQRAGEIFVMAQKRAQSLAERREERVLTVVQPSPVRHVAEAKIPTENRNEPDAGTSGAADAETFKYRFKVVPAAATLYIDGKAVDPFQAVTRGVQLSRGKHTISANGQCCRPLQRTIFVDGPQREILPVTLDWDVGRVRVVTNAKALVWLNGNDKPTIIDEGGRNSTFSFDFGRGDSVDSEKLVTLTIAPHGGQDIKSNQETRKVKVRPGKLVDVAVNFKPE